MNRILGLQNSSGRRILGAQNYVPIGVVGDIVNSRDARLQLEYPRTSPANDRVILLVPSSSFFQISAKGAITPATITFTPIMLGMTGTVAYGSSSGATLTYPGGVPTLNYGDMTVEACAVTASVTVDGITYSSPSVTISKVRDGADADITPETLLMLLEDQITESQLYSDLNTRIDLVDGPSSNPQTVQGRVKAETDARVAAITQEAADRVTYVQSYTYSKQEADNSLSVFATTVTAQYKAYADGVGGAAVSTSNAYVQQYAYSKATSDSSLSSLASTLRSEFASNSGVSVAYLNNYAYSKADTNSAISDATQTLSTTVGQNTSTLQTQATTINGLSAQYTVKTDINGYVTGFGLASSIATGTPTSVFIINAGAFSVVAPGGAPQPMFTVGLVNGQTQAVLRGNLFADGSITASKLTVGDAAQMNPDSNMMDPSFWGRVDGNFIAYPNTFWNSTRVISIGIEGWRDFSTPFFPLVRGGVYLFEAQVYLSGDFVGNISLVAHLPGQEWCAMGAPQRGYSWPDSQGGLPIQFDGNSAKGAYAYNTIRTINGDAAAGKTQYRIIAQCSQGYYQIGGLKITRVMDSVLIKDGAITAQKISVAQLDVVSPQIGILRTTNQGARTEIRDNLIAIYDSNNTRRIHLGDSSL